VYLKHIYVPYFHHPSLHVLILMDVQLCHSPDSNSGQGCGGIFLQKSSPRLCAKCQKLSTLGDGTPEHTVWLVCSSVVLYLAVIAYFHKQSMKQCTGCGLAWKNLTSNMCSRCSQSHAVPSRGGSCHSSYVNDSPSHFQIQMILHEPHLRHLALLERRHLMPICTSNHPLVLLPSTPQLACWPPELIIRQPVMLKFLLQWNVT